MSQQKYNFKEIPELRALNPDIAGHLLSFLPKKEVLKLNEVDRSFKHGLLYDFNEQLNDPRFLNNEILKKLQQSVNHLEDNKYFFKFLMKHLNQNLIEDSLLTLTDLVHDSFSFGIGVSLYTPDAVRTVSDIFIGARQDWEKRNKKKITDLNIENFQHIRYNFLDQCITIEEIIKLNTQEEVDETEFFEGHIGSTHNAYGRFYIVDKTLREELDFLFRAVLRYSKKRKILRQRY